MAVLIFMQNRISNSTKPCADIRPKGDTKSIALVAIDLDGTLLRSDKTISHRTADVVAQVVGCGVHVVLASARPPRGVKQFCRCLALESLQVNYNGAIIHDLQRQEHVFHQPMDANLARRIVSLARQVDPNVVVNIEILDQWHTDRVDPTLHVETSKSCEPDYVGPIDTCLNQPVTKLMFLAPPQRLVATRTAIKRQFNGHIAMAISDAHVVQVMHRDVDKANALQRIALALGIGPEQVMAIGDAPNDIGMICWAGLGVAVANGWSETRQAADVIVSTNDQDGVAEALDRYVL